ncbi:hypothetical protein PCNPT3_05685 [Psychromonas sp. CNPT3]|uniref:hypothetical protein n=1 Tax=Psychromonas sp. CNPT3 TaxID=314282 RepID=UPI00006E4243|nr:hypothetical protein [Psychromonas sp. CNPT3]AGH81079.1 hypothetical protein PCNPT3_05685 [Psychromonas sp. CNPT3]
MNQSNNRAKKTTSGFDDLGKLKSSVANKKNGAPQNKKKYHVAKTQQPNNGSAKNKNTQEFSVRLSRQLNVKRYPVIATICLLQKRTDIVSLLNQAQANPRNLPLRLTSYLKMEGLLNNDNTLTDKAKRVCTSGKMPISERGLYHIWYSDNDPLLGTRALLIQRDNAFKEPKQKILYKGRDAAQSAFAISLQDNNHKTLAVKFSGSKKNTSNRLNSEDIVSILPEVICGATDNKTLNLTWELTLDSSNITLKGPLNILSGHDLKHASRVDFEYQQSEYLSKAPAIFSSLATHLDGHWQQHVQRVSIPFNLTKQHQGMLSRFSLNNYPAFDMATPHGHFDHVDIKHLPVEPILAEATKWHIAWLERYHASSFKETEIAQAEQLSWLDQPALKQCKLEPLSGNNLIAVLPKEKNPRAYWHCAAINDLTPSLSTVTAQPLTLIDKEQIDIEQLIKKLSLDKPCTKFIYSDRYLRTNRQQSLLCEITKPLSNADITIFTALNDAAALSNNLPEQWNIESFSKRADNHDRYWIFQSDNDITAWKCTVSLDFLTNDGSAYYAHGYPTFTPMSIEQLPEYLQRTLAHHTLEVTA